MSESLDSYQTLITDARDAFKRHFGKKCDAVATAPGRINLIGEHTDYTGGLALPAAIDRWTAVAFSQREDSLIKVHSINMSDDYEIDLSRIKATPLPEKEWQKYVYGAISLFQRDCGFQTGLNLLIAGNVPLGRGISSSASLEMALLNAFRDINMSDISDRELIELGQQVENIYLNVPTGLLDQFASQFSREGFIQLVDFRNLSNEYVQTHHNMENHEWALIDSQVKRSLAGSDYETRVKECRESFSLLKEKDQNIKHYRDITESDLQKHLKDEKPILYRRLLHVVKENARTLEAQVALQEGEVEKLGELINETHHSLQKLFEASCKELDLIQKIGIKHPACAGGRMMGGGFGGCVLFLINKNGRDSFIDYMENECQHHFSQKLPLMILNLVWGARIETCKD